MMMLAIRCAAWIILGGIAIAASERIFDETLPAAFFLIGLLLGMGDYNNRRHRQEIAELRREKAGDA